MNNTKKITIAQAIEIVDTASYLKKYTQRQRSLYFKKCIKDLDYIIEHIEPQINKNGVAWHLGQKMYRKDLNLHKAEMAFIERRFEVLIQPIDPFTFVNFDIVDLV